MARRKKNDQLTPLELEIMKVLWDGSPAPVASVQERMNTTNPLAYTTVLRFLQIMTGKRLVVRNEGERGHVYAPAIPAERTKKQMVRDLMDRAFGGSAHELVLQALGAGKVSAAELREIRQLLNELDRK